ncbi:histidinol phosphate phosphatase [Dictyobacter kobayashii]|uniref:D,D-heptose 1,7-bisphosphate phosphatase n=2 Tax=Dictyobacter kobayashii TaxID=2014872 RepID=A0A402AC89_9CHLR|nr:histidinol phosphate phosphatase [Dictyobacter kobayashii]
MGNQSVMSTVFLDRDGVINENRSDYVKNWNEFCFLPGAREAIAKLTVAGHRIVVCSNQAGIATGRLSVQSLNDIHQHMLSEVEKAGGHIEHVYYCPHGKHEGCACRKPRPGLLLRACKELNLALTDAVFIGDNITDVQASFAAGVLPILVLTGLGLEQIQHPSSAVIQPFLVKANLYHAVDAVLNGIYISKCS